MASTLPVFIGAEGFGVYTVAGRGKPIRHVTNLNDAGAGSLRQAILDSGGGVGGQIVFDVAGVIRLQSNLVLQGSFISIFGQTAPLGGIVITDYPFIIRGNDILIQHITVCVGDRSVGSPAGDSARAFNIEGNASFNTTRVVIDHCSAHWGIDDTLTIIQGGGGTVDNVTVQWSLINQCLYDSIHTQGVHSRGLNIANNGNGNVSVHHCIISNNDQRNPNIAPSGNVEVVNNLIINYQKYGAEVKGTVKAHLIGNLFVEGLDYGGGINPPNPIGYPIHTEAPFTWNAFLLGNGFVRNGRLVDPSEQRELCDGATDRIVDDFLFEPNGIEVYPLSQLKSILLRGCSSRPLNRNPLDRLIINQLYGDVPRSRVIDSQTQMFAANNGYPTITPATRAYVEPSTPLADSDSDGYTDLEEDVLRMHNALTGLPRRGAHTA